VAPPALSKQISNWIRLATPGVRALKLAMKEAGIDIKGSSAMQDQEIIDFWGRENLIRFSQAEVADLALSSRSKSFLCEVGLPSPKNDRMWEYTNYHFEVGKLQRMPDRKSCFRIGVGPLTFCIDEERGG
jgi:hypothetical protein